MIQQQLESFEPGYQILLLQPAGSLLLSLFSSVIGLFKALTQISLSGTASCHIDPYVPLLSETQQSRCASSGFYNISSYVLIPYFLFKGCNAPLTRLTDYEAPNFDLFWLHICMLTRHFSNVFVTSPQTLQTSMPSFLILLLNMSSCCPKIKMIMTLMYSWLKEFLYPLPVPLPSEIMKIVW